MSERKPEYLDLTFQVDGSALPVRVAREAAEDDLGIGSLDRETFEAWVNDNQDRILRAALSKRSKRPASGPDEDCTAIMRAGDLKNF